MLLLFGMLTIEGERKGSTQMCMVERCINKNLPVGFLPTYTTSL